MRGDVRDGMTVSDAKKGTTMKTKYLYQIRRWPNETDYSVAVSRYLRPYHRARKLAKRLGGFIVPIGIR